MGAPVPRITGGFRRPQVIDDQILEALKDYHVVKLESDEFYNDKLTWCLEHCQNKFRDFRGNNCRAWYFKEEQDAMMFAMKWSS
jgi:hypothetical protein